jgi:putative ABC transport system ATP-binding protein
MISLRSVSKTYGSREGGCAALSDVDLEIGKGEFVAIVGKSGSGKSTLLNVLGGIDRPSSGSVRIADRALEALDQDALATWRGRTVGIVFQFFQLLTTLTALENILLPMDFCGVVPPANRAERGLSLLKRVGLLEKARAFPGALSGGEQQRVAIARALANDPPVILADEPTGNLDSVTGEAILSLFRELVAEGKTIVLVTHDPEASRLGRTVTLLDGRIG